MKGIVFLFAFLFSLNSLFGQNDSVSRIYVGITVVPVAPVFHRVEDTTYAYTQYSPLTGNPYQWSGISHIRPVFNISSGAMLFVSFNKFFDISAGIMGDIIPYHFYSKENGVITEWKYFFLRPVLNFKFNFSNKKPTSYFIQMGVQGKYYRILDSWFQFGGGVQRINNRLAWSTQLNISFHREIVSGWDTAMEKSKIFISPMLVFGLSYYLF